MTDTILAIFGLLAFFALVAAVIGGWWIISHISHENQMTDPFGLAKKSDDSRNRPL